MDILSEIQGETGWITLNRPRALNALSLSMIRKLTQILKSWEQSPSLKTIFINSNSEKAFCAGGDIRFIYEAQLKQDWQACKDFFGEEYALNAQIYTYSKPYVALIDGIAMGGGMGISMTGCHRIMTERAILAMPETGIGLFPDAGGTTFLNETPGATGLYLGLTGFRLKAEDALWAGLATHFIPSSKLPLFKADVSTGMPIEEALSLYSQKSLKKGFLEQHQAEIEAHFNKSSLNEIFQSLAQDSSSFAQTTYQTLRSKSPTSLMVTFKQLKEVAPSLSFLERMEMEFKLSQHFVRGHDLHEGIRAAVIDKDHQPQWKPSKIEDVNERKIKEYF